MNLHISQLNGCPDQGWKKRGWCLEVHMMLLLLTQISFVKFKSFVPRAVSLVPLLVVPVLIMLLLLLHGNSSLLFPALFSTRRIVCCSVSLFGSHHVLASELWLLSQLVLINNATFILTCALRVGPFLFLSWSEDSVKDDPWVMHHGCNNKDILPLQTSL